MIFGDIETTETTEKVEYEDLLKNYYEKMEIIEEQDKEIERLNNIINELEKYLYKIKETSTPQERIMAKFVLKYIDELKGEDKE